jgi:hypothetical protein
LGKKDAKNTKQNYSERGSERQKSLHWKVRTSKVSLIWSECQKSKDQNVKSIFRTSKMTYLWRLGLPNLT